MSDGQRQVRIMRLPIGLPCPVPVVPGSPDTMCDGEPIPLEQRTECCAVNAYWLIGEQVTCDVHLRVACDLLEIDFDELEDEAGGKLGDEARPWAERERYDQDDKGLADEATRRAWSEGKVIRG